MKSPSMESLPLTAEMLAPDAESRARVGRFCRMIKNKPLVRYLAARYGRRGLCLKALRGPGETWESLPMIDAARVQNIGAFHNVAPRVYDVVRLPGDVLAQVTDWAPQVAEPSPEAIKTLLEVIEQAAIGTGKKVGPKGPPKWDIVTSVKNWGGDWFLDWGGLYLENPLGYMKDLAWRASARITAARRGEPSSTTYQSRPELGLQGSRDTEHRIQALHLEDIDWRGKTVLDLGCNLGAFSFYADRQGALRVVGVDRPMLAGPMREVANLLGYWNVDFVGAELPDQADRIRAATGIGRFDVVLALSVCNHVGGYAPWIADLCKDMLILEGHGGDAPEHYVASLDRDFAKLKMIGYTTDRMWRPVYHCRKRAK